GGLSSTTTTLTSTPSGSATFGQQVTLTATVSPSVATGKVTFYDETTILGVGTLSGGQAVLRTIALPSGTRSLRAFYSGDASDLPSASTNVSLTVTAISGGSFTPVSGSPITSGTGPWSVAAADFNGDGKADLA